MNLFSWILLIAVAVCFVAALVRMVKNKGGCSCGGSGGNCSECSGCKSACPDKKP